VPVQWAVFPAGRGGVGGRESGSAYPRLLNNSGRQLQYWAIPLQVFLKLPIAHARIKHTKLVIMSDSVKTKHADQNSYQQ